MDKKTTLSDLPYSALHDIADRAYDQVIDAVLAGDYDTARECSALVRACEKRLREEVPSVDPGFLFDAWAPAADEQAAEWTREEQVMDRARELGADLGCGWTAKAEQADWDGATVDDLAPVCLEISMGYAEGLGMPGGYENALIQVEAMDRLSTAAVMVMAYRIDQARDAGAPWSAIGDVLGITKQAAQQRFGKQHAGPKPQITGQTSIEEG